MSKTFLDIKTLLKMELTQMLQLALFLKLAMQNGRFFSFVLVCPFPHPFYAAFKLGWKMMEERPGGREVFLMHALHMSSIIDLPSPTKCL